LSLGNDNNVLGMTAGPLGVHTKRDVVDPTIGRAQIAAKKKVTRYFPSQVPKWVKAEPEPTPQYQSVAHQRIKQAPVVLSRNATARAVEPAIEEKEDEQVAPEAEDEAAARRARVREKLRARVHATDVVQQVTILQQQPQNEKEIITTTQEKVLVVTAQRPESSVEEESSSEYSSAEEESSFDDEEARVRPVFVPRHSRNTVREAKELKEKEIESKAKEAARKEARKQESRALVAEVVQRSEQEEITSSKTDGDSEIGAPDDVDSDDEVAYQAWRLRELKRIARDTQVRSAATNEAAETERRRHLTPEQRAAEDEALGKGKKPPKAKWKFLQKYHHKGAFFMDEDSLAKDDVRKRDIDGATGIDKFDRDKLPKVLQVRDFGFSGRTKYTHLADQDTTFIDRDYEYGWHKRKSNDTLRQKYDAKRAGQGDIDAALSRRPSVSKRKHPSSSSRDK